MSSGLRRSPASALAALAVLLGLGAGSASAAEGPHVPASGTIAWSTIAVRSAPNAGAARVAVLDAFEPDFRPRVVHAVGVRLDARGRPAWYRIALPGRPNGRTGWVAAAGVDLRPTRVALVVRLAARTLELRRGGRVLLRARVAVGAPGMETPAGTFYVTRKFRPAAPVLGAYAFATSAYSKLSEWPGGGIVGIHGTNAPGLLGRAVSHGCVRVENRVALRLSRLVPVGTPIRITR